MFGGKREFQKAEQEEIEQIGIRNKVRNPH